MVASGGLEVMSLRHAKTLREDDVSEEPVWPWVVAGMALLGIAVGVAAVNLSTRPVD